MNDERFLKEWLHDDAPDSTGARKSADQIMARLPQTRQRRRWWPFALSHPSTPKPPRKGGPPSVRGGTKLTFSPSTAIVVGAITLAIGGALVTQGVLDGPTPKQGVNDAATTDVDPSTAGEPSGIGAINISECETRELEVEDQAASGGITGIWKASDARLSGVYTGVLSHNRTPFGSDWIDLVVEAIRVENEAGAWRGSLYFPWSIRADTDIVVLTGERGYDGLSAVIAFPMDRGHGRCVEFRGVVVDSMLTGVPGAYVSNGIEPPLVNPVEVTLTDEGITTADLPFDDEPVSLVVTNDGSTDHGLVITAGEPPQYLAGYPDDLLAPGESMVVQVYPGDAIETYHMYDPTDEAGTMLTFDVDEP